MFLSGMAELYDSGECHREAFTSLRAVDFLVAGNFSGLCWRVSLVTMGYSGMSRWWLMAGADPYRNNSLRLYYTDDLRGVWKEHPMSPIVKDDANIARPGGRIIMHEEDLSIGSGL